MKTLISQKSTHIIIKDNSLSIYGKTKIFDINIGLNKLNDNNFESFFQDKRFINKLKEKNIKKKHNFTEGFYLLYKEILLLGDIFELIAFYKSKINFLKYKTIGICIEKEIFIFHKNDVEIFISNIIQNINSQLYKNLYDIYYSKNIKIFYSQAYRNKNITKLQIFLAKNNNYTKSKPGIILQYKKNNPKLHIIEDTKKRDFFLKKIFTLQSYEKSIKNNIFKKLKCDFFNPIKSIYKYKSSISYGKGFGYGSIYGISDNKFIFYSTHLNSSCGFHYSNYKIAKIKAFVEGIERFNSAYFPKYDIKEKLPLRDYNLKIIEKIIGYNLNNIDKNNIIGGNYIIPIKAKETNILLQESEKILAPYNILYYPILSDKNIFYYANSSGIGGGRSYEEAIIGGLLELSERDSLMLTWLLKLTPDIIKNSSLPIRISKKVNYIEKMGKGNIKIFDISYDKDFFHTMILFQENKSEVIHIGASAGNKISDVINKALDEVMVNVFYGDKKIKEISNFSEVKDVSDHRYFYSQKGNKQHLKFLLYGNHIINFKQLKYKYTENLQFGEFLHSLQSTIGGKFYLLNLTTKYSKKLGIFIVRVLSENLIPIWFGSHEKPPLEKKRLSKIFFKKYQKNPKQSNIPDFLHFFD